MICVVVLQSCMCYVEGETCSCGETCVTFDVIGAEEISVKVEDTTDVKEEGSIEGEDTTDIKEEGSIEDEEAIDINYKIPEFVSVSSIKTEHEVSFWGVCEMVGAHAFWAIYCHEKETVKFSALCYKLCAI